MYGAIPLGVQPRPMDGPICHRFGLPGGCLIVTVLILGNTDMLSSLGAYPLTHA